MTRFTVVSWNVRHASASSPAWDYLLELDPAVALLQEVVDVPLGIAHRYDYRLAPAAGNVDPALKYNTGLLVRGRIGDAIPLTGPSGWVDDELTRFSGNLVAHRLTPADGPEMNAISVYSPAFAIDRERLAGIDTGGVKLEVNPDVWLTDILSAALKCQTPAPNDPWIIGGDLNLSETFDHPRNRGNGTWLKGMAALGLTECLKSSQGALTPTFRHARGFISHQMDHLFVTRALADRLICCETGPQDRVFGDRLSDHLPIVARFEL